jgi:hypothetical protein
MGLVSSLFPWRPALEQHLDRRCPASRCAARRPDQLELWAGNRIRSVMLEAPGRCPSSERASSQLLSLGGLGLAGPASQPCPHFLFPFWLVSVLNRIANSRARTSNCRSSASRASSPALDSGGADIGTLALPLGFEELTGVGASRLRCIAWGPMTSSGRLRAFRRCRISAVLADFRSIGYNL